MLVIKKIMIVLACILMSGVRDKSEDTTFKFGNYIEDYT